MINRRTFIRTIIIELIFFAILHSLVSTLSYALFADLTPALLTFLLLIPYFGMYLVRGAKNIAVFLGAHIALTAWPLFLPAIWTPGGSGIPGISGASVMSGAAEGLFNADGLRLFATLPGAPLSYMLNGVPMQNIAPLRICWFIFLIFAAIRSIRARLKGPEHYETGYLIFCIALLTALSLISGYFEMRAVTAVNAIWAFMMITGYLVYNQTIRIDESLGILQFSGKQPVNAIIRFNNAILAVFLIPVVLFAIMSPWLPLDRIAGLIGMVLIAVLRVVFRFVGWFMSLFESESAEVPPDEIPPEPDSGPFMADTQETPAWLALIQAIINVLLQILIVALIAGALAYGAYRFYKKFVATRGKGGGEAIAGDTSEYIGPKLAAKPIAEALNSLLRRLSPRSESERIRRLYFKKVRWHIRHGAEIQRADTAGQIAAKLRPAENIDELTAQYERARYSDAR